MAQGTVSAVSSCLATPDDANSKLGMTCSNTTDGGQLTWYGEEERRAGAMEMVDAGIKLWRGCTSGVTAVATPLDGTTLTVGRLAVVVEPGSGI